jgi:hypothetical protein
MPGTIDADLLAAALAGYESMRADIESHIADLRRKLGQGGRISTKHRISAAGRARIAAAQKKRWAAAKRAEAAKPPLERARPKKRVERTNQSSTNANRRAQTRAKPRAPTAPKTPLHRGTAKKSASRPEKQTKRQRPVHQKAFSAAKELPVPEISSKPVAPIEDTGMDQAETATA